MAGEDNGDKVDASGTVCIGVMADIQYSDTDDKYLEKHGFTRSYRDALPKTVEAVKAFTARGCPYVLHLGDIVDGRDVEADRDAVLPAVLNELDTILKAIRLLPSETHVMHVVGNHCLYAGRDVLESQLGIEGAPYYATDVSPNWTVIVLDTVHVGVDRPQGDPRRLEADKYLRDHGKDENAVPWNGGLGVEQTAWLRIELAKARSLKKRVIVCGHHPIVPQAAAAMHTIWNASEVRQVLSEYKEDVVAAYFAGHYHDGGYALVDGIHHVTFPAILDSDPSNVRLSNLEAEKLSGDSTVERWQNSNSLF